MEKKNRFLSEKQNRLRFKEDESRKGSIDEPIVDLIDFINNNDNYYTTSSCSGRLIVIANNSLNEQSINEKKGIKWLYVSHNFVKFEDMMTAIESNENSLKASFKFEPFILHVCCDGLTSAKLLLNCALSSGFRNSGLTISRSERIIVAVRSSHSLEIPIICDKQLIVSKNYIQYIIEIANQKLKQNFERINKFYSSLKSLCSNNNNV
jgi:tRNA wybutosine-synthesizing protein 3